MGGRLDALTPISVIVSPLASRVITAFVAPEMCEERLAKLVSQVANELAILITSLAGLK